MSGQLHEAKAKWNYIRGKTVEASRKRALLFLWLRKKGETLRGLRGLISGRSNYL